MANITESLRKHHAYCDELFAACENAVQESRWADCRIQYPRFLKAIEEHFAGEETILFPAFEEATGMAGGPTQMMRMEHEQMRGLLEQMGQAVAMEDADGFSGAAETLLILMQQHNLKEENILYPMCDDTLTQRNSDIGSRLAAHLEQA